MRHRSTVHFAALLAVVVAFRPALADDLEQADEALLRAAGVGTDGPGLVQFFHERSLSEPGRRRLEDLIRQFGATSYRAREQATEQVRTLGRPALPFLRPALLDPDLEIVRRAGRCIEAIDREPSAALPAAAVRLLTRRRPEGGVEALLAYLPFAEEDSLEEETLSSLATLVGGEPQPALVLALRDTTPARRAAAACVLGRLGDKAPEAKKLLGDSDPRVRLRAAQGRASAGDRDAVPVLVRLLVDTPPELAWQAEELLQRVASDHAPDLPADDGSEGARYRRRDAWASWWREHSDSVDLSRVDQSAPYLGLTLIAQMDQRKIWECDRTGKARWTLDNLQGPIDAQVLPGNRVLVAEYQGQLVTERTMQNRVVWEKRLQGNPTVCQRLPNGNTFIATYTHLIEVARDGREVYAYPLEANTGPVYGAQKLRTGRIVCVTSQGTLLEVDASNGKTLRSLPATVSSPYSVEGLSGGRYLLANYNQNKVIEVDASGRTLWQCAVPGAYHATRLPNGNTLVSSHSGRKLVEVNHEGKTVWELPTNGHVWRVHRR
jgi:HEAT repeat protein